MPGDDHETTAGRPEPAYSILPAPRRKVSCAACGRRFAGSGPVGCRDGAPICDLCLFEGDAELGMVVALISVARAYASVAGRFPGQLLDPLLELGSFARLYERFAATIGPPRLFAIPGFTEKHATAEPATPAARKQDD